MHCTWTKVLSTHPHFSTLPVLWSTTTTGLQIRAAERSSATSATCANLQQLEQLGQLGWPGPSSCQSKAVARGGFSTPEKTALSALPRPLGLITACCLPLYYERVVCTLRKWGRSFEGRPGRFSLTRNDYAAKWPI